LILKGNFQERPHQDWPPDPENGNPAKRGNAGGVNRPNTDAQSAQYEYHAGPGATSSKPVSLLDKWRAMQAAFLDTELGATAKNVFGLLLDHRNGQTGQCNPSIARLAEKLGVGRHAVMRAIKELEVRGWLSARRTQGERTDYVLRFPESSDPDQTGCNNATGVREAYRGTSSENATTTRSENATGTGCKKATRIPETKPVKESIGGDIPPTPRMQDSGPEGVQPHHPVPEPVRSSRPQIKVMEEADRDFADWWAQYPKQEGEDGARREYRAARQRGATAAELLNGAMRYAASVGGKEPRFITMPIYWLRDGRWKDSSQPVRINSPVSDHRPPRHAERGFTPEGLERITAIVAASKAEQARERALNGGRPLPVSF